MRTVIAPKQTFCNLPLEKQRKIEAALIHEFATKGYRKASLNVVVRRLGIAKGSLYQYFSGKESIFLFVFERFAALVKRMVGPAPSDGAVEGDFWDRVRRVLVAGMTFIDTHPEYFQLYLNVLFEQDVPHREELIAKVRLFSMEYFGPLVEENQRRGLLIDLPAGMVVFIIDAALDRFLQGYACSYLDGGLRLAEMGRAEALAQADIMLCALRRGLQRRGA